MSSTEIDDRNVTTVDPSRIRGGANVGNFPFEKGASPPAVVSTLPYSKYINEETK